MAASTIRFIRPLLATGAIAFALLLHAQEGGAIHGNFSTDGQLYNDDEQLGAVPPPQDFGLNAWGNLNYANGDFRAGMRFESYEPDRKRGG